MDIYSCKLYNLILSQAKSYEDQLRASNQTLRDLVEFNYDENRKKEIALIQVNHNEKMIESYIKQITSFHHCGKCFEKE